ncbi:unnamed protein product [Arctogadus glacialis]
MDAPELKSFWPEHKGIINDTCNGNTAPIHEALVAFDWLVTRPIQHLCTDSVRHLPDLPPLRPYGPESEPRHDRDGVRGVCQASAVIGTAVPGAHDNRQPTAIIPPSSRLATRFGCGLRCASPSGCEKTEPSYA